MTASTTDLPTRHASYDVGYGWVLFAAVVLMLMGTVNLIEGLAAVSNSAFFVRGAHYITGSLKTWGWTVTIVGTCEFVAGFFVLIKNPVARWAAVVLLGVDTAVQLILLPAAPFWSLAVFAVNILAIYALLAHGAIVGDRQQSH